MSKKLDISKQMATAPVWSLIIKLSIPAILAQIVNLLYNLVDRIYIGHMDEVGTMAITGVGLCFPVLSLISAFTMLVAQAAFQDIAVAAGADLSGEDIQLGAEVAYAVRDARESGGQLGAANGRAREGLCRIGERALR